MKAVFDFLPLLIFFITFKVAGIFPATAAIIVASTLQFAYLRITRQKINPLQIFSLVLVILLGGGALIFQDQRFLFWKPTLANLVFAGAVLATLRPGAKPAAQMMYEEVLGDDAQRVTPRIWRSLSLQWIAFFLLEGTINIFVAFNCELDTWVKFKVFGLTFLTLVMGGLQMLQLKPFLSDTKLPPAAPQGEPGAVSLNEA